MVDDGTFMVGTHITLIRENRPWTLLLNVQLPIKYTVYGTQEHISNAAQESPPR